MTNARYTVHSPFLELFPYFTMPRLKPQGVFFYPDNLLPLKGTTQSIALPDQRGTSQPYSSPRRQKQRLVLPVCANADAEENPGKNRGRREGWTEMELLVKSEPTPLGLAEP